MRIRSYKQRDSEALLAIAQRAAEVDETTPPEPEAFAAWLADPALDATANVFVITDDDDELQTWGQAGTLEGIEGEIVGYTVLQLQQDHTGYTFLCQGAVHPAFRRQHVGSILFVGALNRAHLLALEFDFEAEEAGLPIYFSAFLPRNDPAAAHLARRFEMEPVALPAPSGLQLYRQKL
ncbi:MAG TPA: GNAT family N-acetyltransferase [Ktedonobacteraceae bacterium]|nr:GNAT family N-acetyltransferase [Ktedonobacteraceae bacterium]